MTEKKTKARRVPKNKEKNLFISFGRTEKVVFPELYHTWSLEIGNITISTPRCKKSGVVHITTGRKDSLEGGDFKVSELEKAIQDFYDRNF